MANVIMRGEIRVHKRSIANVTSQLLEPVGKPEKDFDLLFHRSKKATAEADSGNPRASVELS